jgi:hypothetical protein
MHPPEGRSPHPKDGDPNVKMMRLSLTPGEWRKLRVWAAEQDSTVEQIVQDVLRRALEGRPSSGF